MIRIIPAILEKDVHEVQKKLEVVSDFAELAQIDIADGKFVASTTVAPAALAMITLPLPVEIHLMVQNPQEYFQTCAALKAQRVFWHYEAVANMKAVLEKAGEFSFANGIALNPETPLDVLSGVLERVDAVLLMGVTPGAQGRPFVSETIERVKTLRSVFGGHIAVDGAVSEKNIAALVGAGATDLAVGSVLFKSNNIVETYKKLQQLAGAVR
jgi:ribulose-phosphate 3-epimerase